MNKQKMQELLPFELPDWFSLDNYESVEKFGAKEWAYALSLRESASTVISREVHLGKDYYNTAIRGIKEAHEKNYKKLTQPTEFLSSFTFQRLKIEDSGVRVANMDDVFLHYDFIKNSNEFLQMEKHIPDYDEYDNKLQTIIDEFPEGSATRTLLMAIIAMVFQRSDILEPEHDEVEFLPLVEPINNLSHAPDYNPSIKPEAELISVDLNCTNELLTEQFKKLLINLKKDKSTRVKKNLYNQSDYKKWTENKVLSYIDLMLLAKLHKSNLKESIALEILFGEQEKTVDQGKISKTLKDYVRKLLNPSTIKALSIQGNVKKNS